MVRFGVEVRVRVMIKIKFWLRARCESGLLSTGSGDLQINGNL